MLLENYPNIKLQNNETLKKLIDVESYLVVIDSRNPFPRYNVYINDKIVGVITSNPVFCIKFLSQVKEYSDVVIFNQEYESYGKYHG